MSFWLEHDPRGQVLAVYSGNGEQQPLQGGTLVEVDRLYDPGQSMFVDGRVLDLGPPPSPKHTMDFDHRAWIISRENEWAAIIERRNALLTASDPVVLRAYEQGAPVPQSWVAYRQALRDITAQGDPGAVVWPTIPG